MNIDLSGTTALVTGSTGGIGHAIAKGFAGAGADVIVNGRGQAKVDQAIASIGKVAPSAKVRGVAADVSTAEGCAALVKAVPQVDILITTPAFSSRSRSSTFPMKIGTASSTST